LFDGGIAEFEELHWFCPPCNMIAVKVFYELNSRPVLALINLLSNPWSKAIKQLNVVVQNELRKSLADALKNNLSDGLNLMDTTTYPSILQFRATYLQILVSWMLWTNMLIKKDVSVI